jgi:hypothetical protein
VQHERDDPEQRRCERQRIHESGGQRGGRGVARKPRLGRAARVEGLDVRGVPGFAKLPGDALGFGLLLLVAGGRLHGGHSGPYEKGRR